MTNLLERFGGDRGVGLAERDLGKERGQRLDGKLAELGQRVIDLCMLARGEGLGRGADGDRRGLRVQPPTVAIASIAERVWLSNGTMLWAPVAPRAE